MSDYTREQQTEDIKRRFAECYPHASLEIEFIDIAETIQVDVVFSPEDLIRYQFYAGSDDDEMVFYNFVDDRDIVIVPMTIS